MKSITPEVLFIIEENLRKTGFARFRVISNSMLPIIHKGDWIEVGMVKEYISPKVGDIILYRRPNDFVLHRVVKIGGDLIWTKGDRNRTIDHPIKHSDVIAVLTKIQKSGFWLDLKNPIFHSINRSIGKISSFFTNQIT